MDNSVALLSSVIYDDKVVKCGYTYYFGNPEILLSKPFTDMFLNRHWKAWVNIMLSVLLMIKLPLFKTFFYPTQAYSMGSNSQNIHRIIHLHPPASLEC